MRVSHFRRSPRPVPAREADEAECSPHEPDAGLAGEVEGSWPGGWSTT